MVPRCCLLLLLLSRTIMSVSTSISVEVDATNDSLGLASNCEPSIGSCNLRSAWELCMAQSSGSTCTITLPENSAHTINATLGHLELDSGLDVTVEGNGAVISLLNDGTSNRRLDAEHAPDQAERRRTAVSVQAASDFPFQMNSFEDSNFAKDVYDEACVTGCPYDVLTFSGCGGFPEDTVFRLFQGSEEVATNDDFCDFTSQIEYAVPSDGGCKEYCLRMGCFGTSPCPVLVNFEHLVYIKQAEASTSSRLFYYNNTDTSDVPSLNLRSLTFQSFGDLHMDGGVIYIAGQVSLTIDQCNLTAPSGYVGGAVYITNNAQDVNITRSVFEQSDGIFGGAIYAGSEVHRLTITDCEFTECNALALGGAVLAETNNVGVLVVDCKFADCRASNGGAIAYGRNNSHWVVESSRFDRCTSDSLGGAISVITANNHGLLRNSTFTECESGLGGALSLRTGNHYVRIEDSDFDSCYATQLSEIRTGGGAILVHYNNTHVEITGCLVTNCESAYFGGGISLTENNDDAHFDGLVVADCTGWSAAGGILLASSNKRAVMTDVNITRCTGGGLFVDSQNSQLTVVGMHVRDCIGGGLLFAIGNRDVAIMDTTIVACKSGGVQIEDQNNNFTMERTHIRNCDADTGAGINVISSEVLVIKDSVITGCRARRLGGGIAITGATTNFVLLNSTLSNNTARYGGGLHSGADADNVAVVSSAIHNNRAVNHGGGIFVDTGNPVFSVLDARTYAARLTVESPHPYEYTPDFITQEVRVDGAHAYYIYFDANSRLWTIDSLRIQSGGTYLFREYDAAWPGLDMPPLLVQFDRFTVEFETYNEVYAPGVTLADNYYGYRIYVIPVFATGESPTVLSDNSAAGNGGGLFLSRRINMPVSMHTRFVGNTATNGGGAHLRSAVLGMVMYGNTFVENHARAGSGGAVAVASVCHGLRFASCKFVRNHAHLDGGAIWFSSSNGNDGDYLRYNENELTSSVFHQNTANGDGGAVYLALDNVVEVHDTTIAACTAAGNGGAIALSEGNRLRMNGSQLSQNIAGACGGGIAAQATNVAILNGVDVKDNRASTYGGGVCLKTDSLLSLGVATLIRDNRAAVAGGGIACLDSYAPVSAGCTVQNNSAPHGSGLYLSGLNEMKGPALLEGLTFAENVAVSGTVFWVNATMSEPQGWDEGGVSFDENLVRYGADVATQAVRMDAPDSVAVLSYGAFLDPPIVIRLTDRYNQGVEPQFPDVVTVSILNPSVEQCGGRFPFLSGTDASSDGVSFVGENATFRSMAVSCAPGGQITLLFTATLGSLPPELTEDQRTLYGTTVLSFRDCAVGETIVDGACVRCPVGSYSLAVNVTASTVCTECLSLSSVDSCVADQIVLSDGYWRRYPTSEAIMPCLDELSGCGGGDQTADASCLAGYEGPLCSLCSPSYYRSDKKCIPCADKDHFSPSSAFFVAVGGALLLGAVGFLLFKARSSGAVGGSAMFFAVIMNLATWFKKEMRDMKVQMKIVITTFQITSAIPVSMVVAFPPQFAQYLDAMTVFNLNVMSSVPVDCANQGQYNFMDKLVMLTLAPIGLSLLLLVICIVEFTYRRLHFVHLKSAALSESEVDVLEKKLSRVVSRYLTLFFLLTYLVLPFIATTLFRTFLCTDLDPDNEDSDPDDLFLTADMRISCASDYYKRGVAYAAVMIVVYVVGIPLMYLILLYRSRKEIKERFDPPAAASSRENLVEAVTTRINLNRNESSFGLGVGSEEPVNQLKLRHDHAARDALMISFLYEAYEPQYWYWEVVETTRRLMLTAVLSVCGPGTSAQALLAVLLALMYIKLYGYFTPYLKAADDVVAETGQFQIFLSFLGALVYQRQLLGDSWNSAIGTVLIVINTAVFVLFAYFAGTTLYNDVKVVVPSKQPAGPSVDGGEQGKGRDDSPHAAQSAPADVVQKISPRPDPRKVYIAPDAEERDSSADKLHAAARLQEKDGAIHDF